jgi:ketosteroid isomerase-like protein
MRIIVALPLIICGAAAVASYTPSLDAAQADEVIALERGALDRWGKGDPQGFIEIYAAELTYFDPAVARRIDGLTAMKDYLKPITGKVKVARYEMIGAKVQRHGDVAVLTYNLESEAVQPDGKHITVHWNSTSVYARLGRAWKMIHSHWSFTKPPGAPVGI